MKIFFDKNITDVPFFKASGVHAGLKKRDKKDLCVIFSEKKAVCAGTFTTNKVKAAPLLLNMKKINNKNTQAIVVNSGIANSCTGDLGMINAEKMAKITADCLNLSIDEVLVASTGVIGTQLPMDKIEEGIKAAAGSLSDHGGNDAHYAIMTTDTFPKKVAVETEIDGKKIILSAMAKGSGMIHPNMGTMLSFIMTNVSIEQTLLAKALKESVINTYNMVSIDGDTSTNDSVLILANGSAENKMIDSENDDYINFFNALNTLNTEMAKLIAKDGEGATKLIEAKLCNARTLEDARKCAKSIITSSLVKTAIFGSDANWGRIMCALGYSNGDFNPLSVDIWYKNSFGEIQVVRDGAGLDFDEEFAKKILDQEYVNIYVDLKDGEYNATAWGCDLTYDYVKINGSYRS